MEKFAAVNAFNDAAPGSDHDMLHHELGPSLRSAMRPIGNHKGGFASGHHA